MKVLKTHYWWKDRGNIELRQQIQIFIKGSKRIQLCSSVKNKEEHYLVYNIV